MLSMALTVMLLPAGILNTVPPGSASPFSRFRSAITYKSVPLELVNWRLFSLDWLPPNILTVPAGAGPAGTDPITVEPIGVEAVGVEADGVDADETKADEVDADGVEADGVEADGVEPAGPFR